MPARSPSFIFDLFPAKDAAERLRIELATVHELDSRVYSEVDTVVLLIEGRLPVWGYASWWRWWSGQTTSKGRWIYACAPTVNAATAARLIVARYTELIAAQPPGTGRR